MLMGSTYRTYKRVVSYRASFEAVGAGSRNQNFSGVVFIDGVLPKSFGFGVISEWWSTLYSSVRRTTDIGLQLSARSNVEVTTVKRESVSNVLTRVFLHLCQNGRGKRGTS